jgi:hypothetical protein
MSAIQKDLFICHNSADKDWARKLGQRIESEEFGGRKLSVFFDEWDIELGANILLKLNEGLKQSRFVGLVLSPEMLESDWCALEYTAILAGDPINKQGRLIPLLVRDTHQKTGARIEIPPILMPFNHLDFLREKDFERALSRLLARLRGEPPPRGAKRGVRPEREEAFTSPLSRALAEGRADPDPVPETLVSNLLLVASMPSVVWTAPTKMKKKSELPEGTSLPPFTLKEGRIVSFADLSGGKGPFADLIASGQWQRHAVVEWKKSPDKWRWVIELMNIALKEHLGRHGIGFESQSKRHFFKPRGKESVRLRWGTGEVRTVVRAPDAGQSGGYWVHQAAWLRFETLGSNVFLPIEPTWMFTTDGKQPVPKIFTGPLAMAWGGKERNGAILRNVLMWSDVLAWGHKHASINTGDQPIVIGRRPALVGTSVGLADDHVSVRALAEFTRVEQELPSVAPEESPEDFGYVDETVDETEDDDADS